MLKTTFVFEWGCRCRDFQIPKMYVQKFDARSQAKQELEEILFEHINCADLII